MRGDFIDQRLEPRGYGRVGTIFASSSIKSGPAGCFTVLLEAIRFVFHTVPLYVGEELLVPISIVTVGAAAGVGGGEDVAMDVNVKIFGKVIDSQEIGL